MSIGLALRPYQTESLDALQSAWRDGLQRVAVVLPTGMGKTVIFAELIRSSVAEKIRPMVLVHRDELVKQAIEKIHSAAPDLSIGVIKAERNETAADVVVASVQTLARASRRAKLSPDAFGLLIVDECHHAAADSYRAIMGYFGCFDSTRAVGFTATLVRQDSRGLGDVWQAVAYSQDIAYGITHGYLSDVRGRLITVDNLDLATVARSRGDYQGGSLGEAMEASGAGAVIADAYLEHAKDRQGLLFAPTVATAYSFADDFNARGIVTEVITGETPIEDRELSYKRARAGETQVLSNCLVLTEGFDMPQLSCAVIARPTSSAGLYVQMVGRVLRPYPGKPDALVLDVVGVSATHQLATLADLSETKVKPDEGESLIEAIVRRERERGIPIGSGRLGGELGADDIDLFHRSRSVWLRTHNGHFFIPTRNHTYVLWESGDGTFQIGRCGTYSTKGGEWFHKGLTFEYALAWAEQYAAEEDPTIANRASSWRVKRAKPSPAQIAQAVKCGIEYRDMSKAQLSDAISIHYASRILDGRKAK